MTMGFYISGGGGFLTIAMFVVMVINWRNYRLEFGTSESQMEKAAARGIKNRQARIQQIQNNYNLINVKIKEIEEELADLKEQLKEEQQKADEEQG